MTESPGLLRDLRQEGIDHYRAQGVVHLRGLLDRGWVALAERVFRIVMSDELEHLNHLDLIEIASTVRGAGVEILDRGVEPGQGNPLGRGHVE